MVSTSVDEPAFSDDDEEEIQNNSSKPKPFNDPRFTELSPTAAQSETSDATPKIAPMSAEYYYYYQGNNCYCFNLLSGFLHSLTFNF